MNEKITKLNVDEAIDLTSDWNFLPEEDNTNLVDPNLDVILEGNEVINDPNLELNTGTDPEPELEEDEPIETAVIDEPIEEVNAFHKNLAVIANDMAQAGLVELPEDLGEGLTEDQFRDVISSSANSKAQEDLSSKYNLENETVSRFLEFLSVGGNPKAFIEVATAPDFAEMPLEGEENVENQKIITALFFKQSSNGALGDDEVDLIVEKLEDTGKLEEKSLEVQGKYAALKAQSLDYTLSQAKAEQENKDAMQLQRLEAISNTVSGNEEVLGIPMPSKKQKQTEFIDFMTKKQRYNHSDGKSYMITKSQIYDLENDTADHYVAKEWHKFENYSGKSVASKQKTKQTKSLLKTLNNNGKASSPASASNIVRLI